MTKALSLVWLGIKFLIDATFYIKAYGVLLNPTLTINESKTGINKNACVVLNCIDS